MRSRPPPPAEELRRLYVDEDLPMGALTARYRVGAPAVRDWLINAGIPIRTRRDCGRRRLLTPPPAAELRRLYEGEQLNVPGVAGHLGVSNNTARRWLAEAGVVLRSSPLRDRRRGRFSPETRPDPAVLRDLYVTRQLSLADTAATLTTTVHLVRTWLADAGIATRPGGGKPGRPRRSTPRYQPPPAEELRQLRVIERKTLAELGAHYGVHHQTVDRWLKAYDIPPPPRARPIPPELADEIVARYETEDVSIEALGRELGVSEGRVSALLHAAGTPPRRGRRGPPPALSPDEGAWAEQRYVVDEWPAARIARELGRSTYRVLAHLRRAGVTIVRRTGVSRADRLDLPVDSVARLYVHDELPAEQVGARLGVGGHTVLRTGHSHGLGIRPPGSAPVVPAVVEIIDDLYHDPEVAAVLDRHRVPRRPPGGQIAERFPIPVPLTAELVRNLYEEAGCSTPQIEVLTGQCQVTVRKRMVDWGIPLRPNGRESPALRRIRKAKRAAWLERVVDAYHRSASTLRVSWEYGCSQNTVQRWLREAGVALPGRGRWSRAARRQRSA